MTRTYIDSNILITAFRGKESLYNSAMELLDDPDRALVVSDYLRLEVLPKPTFLKLQEEVEFMQTVFDNAAENIPTSPKLLNQAVELAGKYNLSPVDALHVSAALTAKVDELVTKEKSTKPICQVKEINVISWHSSNP